MVILASNPAGMPLPRYNDFINGLISGTFTALFLSPLDAIRVQQQLNEKMTISRKTFNRAGLGCMASQPLFWSIFWGLRQNIKQTPIPSPIQALVTSCAASTLCNPLFCFRTRISSTQNFDKTVADVWRGTWNLKDKWTRGLGTTYFHNIQFGALVPLTEHIRQPRDSLTTTILKTAIAKTIVGTLWYPSEVYRSEIRMGSNIRPIDFLTQNKFDVFWRGYGIFLLRTVPQTALALGGAIWLSDNTK
ncbi:MAG: hypothetical protein CMM25_07370 [Rhodospirillaceae bacterium]|nr:hypothetical protein [Rhodospirillaceae bacterium]